MPSSKVSSSKKHKIIPKKGGNATSATEAQNKEIAVLTERILQLVVTSSSSSGGKSSTTTHDQQQQPLVFSHLPISNPTLKALEKHNFIQPTTIQHSTIPLALQGRDILGAAKTGSGKTLAFLIPVLERLYRLKWSSADDGLGALIISPTRELALQIFQILRKVGANHSFSAGLLIGGKDNVAAERQRIGRMNVLVATPGRLLQHLDETPDFDVSNLQMLVLDEADRILDCGFHATLTAILEHLPKPANSKHSLPSSTGLLNHPSTMSTGRQTLLFSATQTKSIRDLARLSLSDPAYISVHERSNNNNDQDATTTSTTATAPTPSHLTQHYLVCQLEDKLEILFSFLRTHLHSKILVFLSSCKQVRLVHQIFCKMQPGIVLMDLHGRQKQDKRMAIFEQFCRKKSVCLFATDIAARGLDFPAIDWVIQIDCPEDIDTYIHRVGRTARYDTPGSSLLLLTPHESKSMSTALSSRNIPITATRVDETKVVTGAVKRALMSACAADPQVKYLAQKAFVAYVRSIYLHKNKDIFNVDSLPLEKYADSLGLPGTPRIKFVQKSTKNVPRGLQQDAGDDDDDQKQVNAVKDNTTTTVTTNQQQQSLTKVEKMFKKKNQSVLSEHYQKLISDDDKEERNGDDKDNISKNTLVNNQGINNENEDEEDDFIVLKRADHGLEGIEIAPREWTRKQLLREKSKALKKLGSSQKFKFDEEGNPILSYKLETVGEYKDRLETAIKEGTCLDDDEDEDEEKKEKEEDKLIPAAISTNQDVLITAAQMHTAKQAKKLAKADVTDKQREKERIKEKKRAKKLKEKELRRGESGAGDDAAVLEGGEGHSDLEMDDHDTDGAESAATYESDGAESAATFQRDYVSDAGGDYSDFNIDLDEVEEDVQPQPTSHQKHQQKTNSNKRKISIGGGFIVENEVDTSRIKRNKKTKILDNVQDVTSLEDIAKRLLQ